MDRPPKALEWILECFLKYEDYETILGDFEERYRIIIESRSTIAGYVWYALQIISSIPKFIKNSIIWSFIMFNNYLKIALRNIKKAKGYALINISGLTVGMTCCILILLWVRDELSFDRFHENAEVIYRITEHQYNSSGDYFPVAVTPWPLAEALKNDFPEIVESARLRIWPNRLIGYEDKKFYEDHFVAVDPSFLNLFDFPLVKGDINTALTEPNTILITEETAVRYFGNEDPIGKVLTFHNRYSFEVTGVLENTPRNSHIKFDFLVPFESTLREFGWSDSWGDNSYTTYIQLAENASPQQISEKIYNLITKVSPQTGTRLILQPLIDIHLRSDYAIDLYGHTENKAIYVTAFSVIAMFILLIACINFMNLSTARSEKRSKEVGLRKVVGASRPNIITQFYGESLFMTVISFLLSMLLVYLFLPAFNNVSGKLLTLDSIKEPVFLLGLLGILLITGLVSGSYPALVQSSFKPVDSIKGRGLGLSSGTRKPLFRRVLVIIQFTLSVILIVGTLFVHKQINYMLNKELGYEKDSIIYFIKRAEVRRQYDAFKAELLRDPNITGVTTSSDIPTYTVHSFSGGLSWEGKDPETSFLMHHYSIDHDFIETFNMKMTEGRNFSKAFPVDDSTKSFIVNETAVKAMGLKDPVGSRFQMWGNDGQIVGVVKDFHYKSLQKEIEPLVMRIDPSRDSYVFVKFRPEQNQEAIASVRNVYGSFNPDYPLDFSFLDESVALLYDSEQKTRTIFDYFTIIAIMISCLGLYGLAAYMAQQKTKEIGVRKVLGASITNIVSNLSKEFIILVFMANAVAWPLAYLAMTKWLNNFAYRVNLNVWIFVLSGLSAMAIALFTVSFQSVKAAAANPVEALRYE